MSDKARAEGQPTQSDADRCSMQAALIDLFARDGLPAKQLACLLGGAIGDALGYRVEFDRWERIRARYGEPGIALAKAHGALVVSDDTQMTLFTLDGLARGLQQDDIVGEIRRSYLDWLATQGIGTPDQTPRGTLASYESLHYQRAPGNTCLAALRSGGHGAVDQPINDSKGCGGVMRTAPIGFLGLEHDDREVFRLGVEAGAITHGHPDGYLPAGAMALAVRFALRGIDWSRANQDLIRECIAWTGGNATARILDRAAKAVRRGASRKILQSLGEGWVGEEALAIGLYAAMAATSFDHCVDLAANHSGDSDSTASIAGQLYGAYHGPTVIPMEAASRLDALIPLASAFSEWARVDPSTRGTSDGEV